MSTCSPTLPGWRVLDAVRNRRYAVVSDAVNRPAPRIVSAIEDLAKQLHPEAFVEKPDAAAKSPTNQVPPPSRHGSPRSVSPMASAHLSSIRAEECACAL